MPLLKTKSEGTPDTPIGIQTQNEADVLGCPSTHEADGKQQLQVSSESPAICSKSEISAPDHLMDIPSQSTVSILGYPLTQPQDGKQQPQVSQEQSIINKPDNSPVDLSVSIPTQNTVPVLEYPFSQHQDGKQQPQVSPDGLPIINKTEYSPSHDSICFPTQNTIPVLGYPVTLQQDGKQQPQVSPEAQLIHNKSESTPDHSISSSTQNTIHALVYPSTQQPDGNQQLQLSPEAPSMHTKYETTLSDRSFPTQTAYVLGYPLTLQTDGKQQLQHEAQLIQGGLHYVPQYTNTQMPVSPYYPVYQMPMHQQPIHCQPNQPYPMYLVPVRPNQFHNMPMHCNFVDVNSTSLCRPPLHPNTAAGGHHIAHKDMFGAQTVAESASNVGQNIPPGTSLVSVSSNPAQLVTEPLNVCKPVTPDSVASRTKTNEFDDDVAYSQIYKSQPSAPVLPSQFPTVTSGVAVMLSESPVQMQPNHATEQAASHSLS